jgi:Ca2+-binding EF-hand superfamily protein/diadenosine tetraphosphatase ApaH/serine/threonine PP2A family protein phosphatase
MISSPPSLAAHRLFSTKTSFPHQSRPEVREAYAFSSPPSVAVMLASVGITTYAMVYLSGQEEEDPLKKHADGNTISFQVKAALERNDEIQRIRCAQILFDLHSLAKEQTKMKRRQTVRKMWKFVRRHTPLPSDDTAAAEEDEEQDERVDLGSRRETKEGELSLRNVNLQELSHKEAQDLIEEISKGKRLTESSLEKLFDAAEIALCRDPTLIDLKDRDEKISVVGDLHGSLYSLQHALEVIGPIGGIEGRTVIFDGDFVDRGSESLEVICILLLLKLAYPNHVYLLRGNHEDTLVASAYGFHDELIAKYGEDVMDTIWDSVNAVFSALPLGAVTKTAAILHGGIPSTEFTLDDLKNITTEERCAIKTIMSDSQSKVRDIVRGVLWSDPSPRNGIRPNTTRTVGVFFGPDVARDFLIHHKLKYLIRGHEVAENGTSSVMLDDDHSVVTVFSQPAYPDGLGTNKGAVLELDSDGNYTSVEFSHCDPPVTCPQAIKASNDQTLLDLRSLLDSRIGKIEDAFRKVAPDGKISTQQWENIMEQKLELPGAPWHELVPALVPKKARRVEGYIEWPIFIKTRGDGTDRVIQNLRANHRMLMTVYNFLDEGGDGTINKEEFHHGIELLNKRLPKDRQLDSDELFDRMDLNHVGEVDLEQFSNVFNTL